MTEFIAETEEEVREGLASGKVEKLDGFDYHAGRHWIYPINREIRDYQYSIVHQALFNNTLVVLPTGLGKTLIAAVVMYNLYLWYPQCKIVFMAPTRPLVKQQMEACFDIVGIPREDIVELTGHTTPYKRQEEWQTNRLFFLTPQVMQNDLFLNDYCPAEKIKCIVVDEAHKATGGYAYTRVIEEVYKRNTQFRVLALSATPGKDLIHIKQVLKNLLISKIEYRSEESLDVQKYTHQRRVETIVVQLDEELTYYRDRLLSIIEENLKTLVKRKAIGNYDLNRLSSYYLLMQKKNYEAGQHNIPIGLLNSIRFTFAITTSLIYALDLLKNHGLRSFYNHVKGTRTEDSPKGSASGGKKGFNLGNILKKNTVLQEILEDLKRKFEPDGNVTFNGDLESNTIHSVPGHPKLVKLQEIVLNHFETEGSDTRIMIFSQFRASVEEITCLLRQHSPKIRPVQFVGQSSVKRRGFSQKQQLEVISRFREGEYNVLVATCVAEEGLDIGNVDLIICYDANKSPIRLVQRMGRTGRAREGRIIVLTTAGKEEEAHNDSVYNKKRVATNLLSGVKQEDLFQENVRLYPKGLKPICRKLHLGIRQEKVRGSDDSERSSNEEAENSTKNVVSKVKEKNSCTKKRLSSTKESTSKKRNSVNKRPSAGGSTAKKCKNRFIFQNDEDAELNDGEGIFSDDEILKTKKTKKRVPSKTPSTSSGIKRKRKEPNTDNVNNFLENNFDTNEENHSTGGLESSCRKSFSTSASSLNEISFDDIPANIFDDLLSEGEESDHQKITDSPSSIESPEKKRKKITKSIFEDEEEINSNADEIIKQSDKEDQERKEENEHEKEEEIDQDIDENVGIKMTPPRSSKFKSCSFSFTQIRNKSSSQENSSPKSVPAKKNKWSEFLSDDDSSDSLDYNPLKDSPKERRKRVTSSISDDEINCKI